MSDSTTASETTFRLLDLPPELRIRIYELSFTTDTDEHGQIDLLKYSPPNAALLQTCQQVCQEANVAHKAALLHLKHSTFTIYDRADTRMTYKILEPLDEKLVQQLSNIRLITHYTVEHSRIEGDVDCFWEEGVFRCEPTRDLDAMFYNVLQLNDSSAHGIGLRWAADKEAATALLESQGRKRPSLKKQLIYMLCCRYCEDNGSMAGCCRESLRRMQLVRHAGSTHCLTRRTAD